MKAPQVEVALPRAGFNDRVRLGIVRYRDECANWRLVGSGSQMGPFPDNEPVGAIVAAQNPHLVKCWQSLGIPVVNVSASLETVPFPSVLMKNYQIGQRAADHFLERQFHHFGYIGLEHLRHGRERREGFADTLQAAGKSVDLYRGSDQDMSSFYKSLQGEQLAGWLRDMPRPCGIFCNDDWVGVHVISRLLEEDISVPSEVAVLGVNNDEINCAFALRPLSSVDVNAEAIGYEAAHLLDQLMREPGKPVADVGIAPRGIVTRLSTDITAHEDPVVAKALQFIRENITQPIGVPDVAQAIGVSKRLLERQFSRHLQHGPYEEIVRQRMRRACHLLAGTDWPIHRVANACGYAEYSLFSNTFRRRLGMSPREWRQERALSHGEA